MDSYDEAIERLDFITKDAGWYVYCYEDEKWHLYNDDDQLLFLADTVEELVNKASPPVGYNEMGSVVYKRTLRDEEPPTNANFLLDYDTRSRQVHDDTSS